jgi:hypothetical protein
MKLGGKEDNEKRKEIPPIDYDGSKSLVLRIQRSLTLVKVLSLYVMGVAGIDITLVLSWVGILTIIYRNALSFLLKWVRPIEPKWFCLPS